MVRPTCTRYSTYSQTWSAPPGPGTGTVLSTYSQTWSAPPAPGTL